MRYYNYEHQELMQKNQMDEVLQKYFPSKDFGVCVMFDLSNDNDIAVIQINRCWDNDDGSTAWEHYANIDNTGRGLWEVNTQFNGKNNDELWIFGYYHRFGDAVRRVARGFAKAKPIEVYK